MGTDTLEGDAPFPYTGVVIVHGIGDEKRNDTLSEVVDALVHWFMQRAGFTMRSDGARKIVLRTALTARDNPDAAASQATLDLVTPSTAMGSQMATERLRLMVREVWWAQSFGTPRRRLALQWARLQFREEALRVVLPLRQGARMWHAAQLGPRRDAAAAEDADTTHAAPSAPPPGAVQHALVAALTLYEGIQYVWKLAQWLLLTPLLYLALVLSGALKLLALIPFLRSGILGLLSRGARYLTLHWIGPLQVYLDDAVRSSAIRDLFEREVTTLLRDPRCERLVVIAHSMGTVIAYDSLTALFNGQAPLRSSTPITFICLGQALRRVWLIEQSNPQHVRDVLPEQVRWLNLWARYDPVAAGQLDANAVPQATDGTDREGAQSLHTLRAALKRCVNMPVRNTESLFTDHTTYWQNMDEVVGPIAYELVAGHQALEHLVEQRLATPHDVLVRRWRLAWRATVAIGAGLASGIGFIAIDAAFHIGIGGALRDFLRSDTFQQLVIGLLTGNIPIPRCAPPCTSALPPYLNPLDTAAFLAEVILLKATSSLAAILEVVAAVLVAAVVTVASGNLLAVRPARESTLHRRSPIRVSALGFAVVATSLFIGDEVFVHVSAGIADISQASLVADGVGLLLGIVFALLAWSACLIDAITRRHFVWCFCTLGATVLLTLLLNTAAPILSVIVCMAFSAYIVTLVYLTLGPKEV